MQKPEEDTSDFITLNFNNQTEKKDKKANKANGDKVATSSTSKKTEIKSEPKTNDLKSSDKSTTNGKSSSIVSTTNAVGKIKTENSSVPAKATTVSKGPSKLVLTKKQPKATTTTAPSSTDAESSKLKKEISMDKKIIVEKVASNLDKVDKLMTQLQKPKTSPTNGQASNNESKHASNGKKQNGSVIDLSNTEKTKRKRRDTNSSSSEEDGEFDGSDEELSDDIPQIKKKMRRIIVD